MQRAGSRSRAARTPNPQANRLSPRRHGRLRATSKGRPHQHHASLPEVRQGQDHHRKGPPSHRSPHRDRQTAGQREQSHGPSPPRTIALQPQKTSTQHSDQQRRSKDCRRKPGPRLRRSNDTAEQIDSHCNHHDPDEPLDQTIWVAGGHTPQNPAQPHVQSRAKRHADTTFRPARQQSDGRLRRTATTSEPNVPGSLPVRCRESWPAR